MSAAKAIRFVWLLVLRNGFSLAPEIKRLLHVWKLEVEKGHTSILSAFKFNFHSWLQINTELTADLAVASASSFLCAVVRIETSSAKRAITASSLSEEAKLLM